MNSYTMITILIRGTLVVGVIVSASLDKTGYVILSNEYMNID